MFLEAPTLAKSQQKAMSCYCEFSQNTLFRACYWKLAAVTYIFTVVLSISIHFLTSLQLQKQKTKTRMCCQTMQGGQHFFFFWTHPELQGTRAFLFLPVLVAPLANLLCVWRQCSCDASFNGNNCLQEGKGWETTELIGETWHINQPITSLARVFFSLFPLCLSQVVRTDNPTKASTFPRRSFQSHNPSEEIQQMCEKLAAWQCRRARKIISLQLSKQLGSIFSLCLSLWQTYAFHFFSFPSI